MTEGIIELDSEFAIELGFTSDKFFGYLWRHPTEIYISHIESLQQGQGNLSKLFDAIWRRGYTIKVPTPFARMQAILEHKGFEQTWEEFEGLSGEACEVWVRKPKRGCSDGR